MTTEDILRKKEKKKKVGGGGGNQLCKDQKYNMYMTPLSLVNF
jgi:hypothetical protein